MQTTTHLDLAARKRAADQADSELIARRVCDLTYSVRNTPGIELWWGLLAYLLGMQMPPCRWPPFSSPSGWVSIGYHVHDPGPGPSLAFLHQPEVTQRLHAASEHPVGSESRLCRKSASFSSRVWAWLCPSSSTATARCSSLRSIVSFFLLGTVTVGGAPWRLSQAVRSRARRAEGRG